MAYIATTYTFSNSTTADASQVNQNFTDIINGLSDATKDISINAATLAGNLSVSGNTQLGNASSDDVTYTASLASSIPIKTTNTYDIGSSTLGLRALYFGANSQTVNLKGSSSMSATWTFTLPVTAGTVNYYLETDGSGATSWAKLQTSATDLKNLGLAFSVAANALTITLKGADGNSFSTTNYGLACFRSATLATGTISERKMTSDITLNVSSGSTLGHPSNKEYPAYIYLIDNAGTPELAISSTWFDEFNVVTTTAEGGAGAADDEAIMYSTTARTGVAFRCIAMILSTQTTAGTWAAVPTTVSPTPKGPKVLRAADFAVTRVTATPAKIGEYRNRYVSGASSYTLTDVAPTTSPAAANGYRILAKAYNVVGTSGDCHYLEFYIGKNKSITWEWYQSGSRTGAINTDFWQDGATQSGVLKHYDPSTGVVLVHTLQFSTGNTSNGCGITPSISNVNNVFFDVIIRDHRVGI